MFTYDAAGNLIQREFICNNSGVDIYRVAEDKSKDDSIKTNKDKSIKTGKDNLVKTGDKNGVKNGSGEIIKVNALMPNPTTGKFMVRLADPLKNGNVILLDANGKILQKRRESGNILNFDISAQPSGMYR
ncbi:MAG: T9SS type A sorting domain-containing protein [Chitinophagaceae bacterium]